MLTSRQEKILSLIVSEYVKLVKPVSSNLICKALKCSSATIRNEMMILEELGLLEKTHISSGRIPSEKGYRYYVDNLMELKQISGEDLVKFQIVMNNSQLNLNDYLKKSLEIISELTNYTSVVLGSKSSDNRLKQVEIVPLEESKVLAIVITDKGHIEHKNIELEDVSIEEIKKTVELINNLLVGTPIDEISSKLEFEVKPIIGQYVKQHEAVYNAFYNVFNDFANKNVSFAGKSNILKQPEFNNIDKVKDIVSALDEKNIVNTIEENNNDINIYIGSESHLNDDVTVIKTKYNANGEEGTIAIIGPKRMEYDRVIPLLNYIKENMNK